MTLRFGTDGVRGVANTELTPELAMALGRAAARILGRPEGKTIFAERGFPTVPFYRGNPWFVPHVMACYDWLDRRASR